MTTRGPSHHGLVGPASLLAVLMVAGAVAYEVSMFSMAGLRLQDQEAFIWGSRQLDPVWGVASAIVLLMGSLLFVLAGFLLRARFAFGATMLYALTLLLAFSHVAIRSIEWMQLGVSIQKLTAPEAEAPSLAALSQDLTAGPAPSTGVATALRPGDAELGARLFRSTCASCHGLSGQGIDRQGSPLASSDFALGLDDMSLVAFIMKGRTPNDPQTKLGMLMPPRGGNTRLSDQDLADIVAFIRTLQKAGAVPTDTIAIGSTESMGGVSAEEYEIARSVLAPTLSGPVGTADHVLGRAKAESSQGGSRRALGEPQLALEQYLTFRRAFAMTVAVQLLFVVAAAGVVMTRLLWCLIGTGALIPMRRSALAESLWHLTTILSLFVLPFCYFTEWF
jgi:mono/diheme cytochrome c family protein